MVLWIWFTLVFDVRRWGWVEIKTYAAPVRVMVGDVKNWTPIQRTIKLLVPDNRLVFLPEWWKIGVV